MKLKQNGTGAVNTAKNNVFIFFYWIELTFGGEGIKIWWGWGR